LPYYVVMLETVEAVAPSEGLRQEHLNYLAGLRSRGVLFASGRFRDGSGGLYIVEAQSLDEAISIARSDPYVREGIRRATVKEWERVY